MTEVERFVGQAPPLNDREKMAMNALFPAYLFRRKKTEELWTSCCRRHAALQGQKLTAGEELVFQREHQREARSVWDDWKPEETPCPYCGTPAVVKELGRAGDRGNLGRWKWAVVLRWYRGALWARAYDCGKHYKGSEDTLLEMPKYSLVGVYRFQPGKAECVTRSMCWGEWGDTWKGCRLHTQSEPLKKGKWEIGEPFPANAEYGVGYGVIGLEELEKSPLRYCQATEWEKRRNYLLKYLTACCFYPRQIEMLMKAGMSDVVADLVERGVKNVNTLNWEETDPRKAFGLNGQELKAFLATEKDIRTVVLYKKLERRVTMEQVAEWIRDGLAMRKATSLSKKWGVPLLKLLRYISGQRGGRGTMDTTLSAWEDYLTAAEGLGYPLHRENVLLPPELGSAHDSATAKHRAKLERERKAEEAEKRRLAKLAYAERRAELEKKYALTLDGYAIRVPADGEEIIAEGRALQHCVAGYANRHVKGAVTILFVRREKEPDKPWLTVEMRGNTIVQIHGYRNEGQYSAQGRFAPDPREEHREFLDLWLTWLENGSKRNKDGSAKLPKKRKGNAA